MKKAHAIKWINALRSGDYVQGRCYLQYSGEYCCLGVLDKLFPKLDLSGGDDQVLKKYSRIGLQDEYGTICEITFLDGLFESNLSLSLSDLNDAASFCYKIGVRDGLNFDEIADIIQIEYVEGV